jgi:hypothetical protein
MSRIAKIARLPWKTRETLNFNLRNGVSGPTLVKWLNEQPEVKAILEREFGGVPVSEQNLSAWRRGEYLDWLGRKEEWEWSDDLADEMDSMNASLGRGRLTKGLSSVVASKFARLLANWRKLGQKGFEQELDALRILSREIGRLRKVDLNHEQFALQKHWKMETTGDELAQIFYQWAQRADLQAWRRIEWQDEAKAVEYLKRLLKTDLEGLGLAKPPADPSASAENPQNN